MSKVRGLQIYNTAIFDLLRVDPSNNTVLRVNSLSENLLFEFNGSQVYKLSTGVGTAQVSTFSDYSIQILPLTTDGSDNRYVQIGGGGEFSASRGAYFAVYGNEHPSFGGQVKIASGNVFGASIDFYTGADSKRWSIDASGHLMPNRASYDVNIGSVLSAVKAVYADDFYSGGTSLNSHFSNTSNPHSVTKSQVGLGNVTNDAQLKRSAGDFASFSQKTSVVGNDILLIEDSQDSNNKKKINIGIIASNAVNNEFPTGDIDGVNVVFTTANDFVSDSLQLYLNGLRLAPGAGYDYTITDNNEFTMISAPSIGDTLLCDYRKDV